MADTDPAESEIILSLCHSFFHNAFRPQKPVTVDTVNAWLSSRFVVRFILERKTEMSEKSEIATTSKKILDEFTQQLWAEKPQEKVKKAVKILRNAIYVFEKDVVNKLPIDETIIVISDVLFNKSSYAPILVSNIPSKPEIAEAYYEKYKPGSKMLYPIMTTTEVEFFLRGKFSETCKIVDERIERTGHSNIG